MKTLKLLSLATLFAIVFVSCKKENTEGVIEAPAKVEHKIISLNGSITEIVSALGLENQLVGVDVTSTYPETVMQTAKDLGHVRSISVESLMALQPTLVLASDKDLNPDLISKIKEAGIEVKVFSQELSIEGSKKLVKEVADALGADGVEEVVSKIDADFAQVTPLESAPKVLFIYARGAGTMMVAGKNTPMEKIIELAGGQNIAADFEDFKPFTTEALIQDNPDVILMFTKGLESLGGVEGVLKIQGIEKTNAGKNKKIIALDGQLLSGFGPRVGQAAKELNDLLK